MTEIENAKIILVPGTSAIAHIGICSLVCYFPLHYENNKKEPVNLRKS